MSFRPPIRFCNQCGCATQQAIPDDGDTRLRAICTGCGTVHYQNPLNVVGTIPVTEDGRILLCKRNIEPRKGKWTLPAGFMELGETTAQGALRETQEEAGADIEVGRLFSVISVPKVGQVHLFYCARLRSEQLHLGHETSEAGFFHAHEIPWQELAFRTISVTLEHYLQDRANHTEQMHNLELC